MVYAAYKAKDYPRIITLVDSFKTDGNFSEGKACYWLGYAYDRMMQKRMAELYWRTGIAAVSNSTEDEDIRVYAGITDRITGLVNKMLELSDVNSKAVLERTDQVPAIQIAAQAVEDSGISMAQHLTFDIQIAPEAEDTILQTNLTAATRALALLLDNARKFTLPPEAQHSQEQTEKKEQALLKVATEEGKTLFIVEDTGIGVPVAESEHIFEEFVQLNEYYDGTGIGLTVARSLARRLGGDISLDTSYTGGARFLMTLPHKSE